MTFTPLGDLPISTGRKLLKPTVPEPNTLILAILALCAHLVPQSRRNYENDTNMSGCLMYPRGFV